MSLGPGAVKVSGGPNVISREEVSMATLEAGTTLNKFSGDTYLREYLPEKILTKPPGGEGGEGARIHNDLQEGKN